MTRVIALPHRQATTAVEVEPWSVSIHGSVRPVGDYLAGWDYTTPLVFEAAVRIDVEALIEECGLDPDDTVALIGLWECQSTFRREGSQPVEVAASDRYVIRLAPDPSLIGGRVRLDRRLVLLAAASGPRSPLTASAQGSVLWQEPRGWRTTVALEGDATRFPTDTVDFRRTGGLAPDAAWHLEIDLGDPEVAALNAVRLRLNEGHPAIAAIISGQQDDRSSAVMNALMWDVGRQLIHAALDQPEFVDGWGHFPEDSIGYVLQLLLQRTWPGEEARSLRAARDADPARFESSLQGRLQLFRGLE